jgi:hypothetical protein
MIIGHCTIEVTKFYAAVKIQAVIRGKLWVYCMLWVLADAPAAVLVAAEVPAAAAQAFFLLAIGTRDVKCKFVKADLTMVKIVGSVMDVADGLIGDSTVKFATLLLKFSLLLRLKFSSMLRLKSYMK